MADCKSCGAIINDDAKFCEKCGSPINTPRKRTRKPKADSDDSTRKITYEGTLRKCPNCGDPIDAFELICDKCGYNFSTNRMSTSQERLAAMLAAIDDKNQNIKGRRQANIKEQKALCINTFPVANSIEEITSFMMYACGNIDMSCVGTSPANDKYDTGDHQIAEAWIGKMDQMYQMAKVSFSDSNLFKTIERTYIEKKAEIKKAQRKRFKSNPLLWIAIPIFVVLLIPLIVLLGPHIKDAIKSSENKQLIEQGYISAGEADDYSGMDYNTAVTKLKALGFTNIELIDLDDSFLFIKKDEAVESVTINGSSSFEENDYFPPTAKVIVSYH